MLTTDEHGWTLMKNKKELKSWGV